ncbi:ABC transporter ATP-binding protein [Endothiovibrio diazotrophicus]
MFPAHSNDAAPTPYRWRRIVRLVLDHRRPLVTAHLVAILGVACAVPVPLLMPMLVDEVLLHQPGRVTAVTDALFPPAWHGPVLYIVAVLFVTLFLRLSALGLTVYQSRQFARISKEITYRIRLRLLEHLKRVSMAEYETLGSGAVTSHFVTDVDTVDNFLGQTLSKFLVALLSICGTAGVLLWLHWQLALFILFLNPLVVYITVALGRRTKRLKKRENSAFELFQEALGETLEAIQQVRAANREGFYLGRVAERARDIRDRSIAYAWKSEAAGRLSFAAFLFGFDTFRALSMLMVLFSNLSVGEMFAVFGYLWFMMGPVQEVLNIQYAYAAADGALNRINRLIALHREPHYPHQVDPFADKRTVAVELEAIRFAYGDGPPVLDGVSLRIRPGEKVALVGASGGGKTTLVQVLLGLYPPVSGRVLFDGVAVESIGMEVVRDNVATVLQHPALFNDTVRANLAMGREVEEAALWQALEVAQLAEFIREQPIGLDALVGRHGVRLSGGQRQRLAVARMVLTDPKVVILDEATSALDTATEGRLHAALQRFLEGRTTIIIAHRLSAVKQADRVYVFDAGQIIEEGAHDELVESGGLYARLYGKVQE